MTVYCSHCSTGYLLPDHLLGPRGARVRCPKCGKTFVVLREDADAGSPPAVAPAAASTPGPIDATPPAAEGAENPPATVGAGARPAPGADGETLARELLDVLATAAGARLAEARERGRVLAEFGPELMLAYDEFRRRAGPGATAQPFKAALRERWAVDLITGVEG